MRVLLRDLKEADLADYLNLKHPNRKYHEFNGPYFEQSTEEDLQKEIDEYSKKISEGVNPVLGNRRFIANLETDYPLGEVNWYWKSEETNWLEIGIVIFDELNWSKGIGTRALTLWINQIFNEKPDLIRIGLSTWSGNFGMIRLAEKLGMTEEARYKNARTINGKYYDSVSYGIQKVEWGI